MLSIMSLESRVLVMSVFNVTAISSLVGASVPKLKSESAVAALGARQRSVMAPITSVTPSARTVGDVAPATQSWAWATPPNATSATSTANKLCFMYFIVISLLTNLKMLHRYDAGMNERPRFVNPGRMMPYECVLRSEAAGRTPGDVQSPRSGVRAHRRFFWFFGKKRKAG